MTTTPSFRLEQNWEQTDRLGGKLSFELVSFSDHALEGFRLAYTSLSRAPDDAAVSNGQLSRKFGHFHEFAPPEGFVLEPGGRWTFTLEGLGRNPKHMTDGAQNPYLALSDGTTVPVACGDLMLKGQPSTTPPPRVSQGALEMPLFLCPWPSVCSVGATGPAPDALFPAEGTDVEVIDAIHRVAALHDRLFPEFPTPFALTPVDGGLPIDFASDASLASEAYTIDFAADGIRVTSGPNSGRQYALTTLAQLLYGAHVDANRFRFPLAGRIDDQPRHGWRGCHLDVSRQFIAKDRVAGLIDILAWHKFNQFHWHLTDDEGWRLQIDAYPALTDVGAWRGPDEKVPPLHGSGGVRYGGYYTKADARDIVDHAQSLNIAVLPEIDIPGHCTAALQAVVELSDGQEAPDSYRSIGGFPNNAVNPAVPETYRFLEAVFGEVADLFPHPYIHVGGDEVDEKAWMASPLVRALKADKGLAGTAEVQSYFLRRAQSILAGLGKKLAGWDEVSHGGGVDPNGTLMMAWQSPEVGRSLAQTGYDVVMTPGQAYYLDMVQADDWQEPGASWAGTATVEHTYGFEAAESFTGDLAARLKGIQSCIWTEHLARPGMFRRLVFPRLAAVGESAWTPAGEKSWQRFSALAPFLPTT